MQFEHSMKTEIFFEFVEQAKIVLEAIKPDFRNSFKRSKSSVTRKKNVLEIDIMAKDLTALRASFNSIMKGIVVSGKILKAFD